MWKAIEKRGFSSKSKADLFEGFAETAVEIASSEENEKYLKSLPRRMIVTQAANAGYGRGNPQRGEAIIKTPKMLALISRISSGTIFAGDQTPDIDEKSIASAVCFLDLADPYKGLSASELREEESMNRLNQLYKSKSTDVPF
jgi:hypothetical protein